MGLRVLAGLELVSIRASSPPVSKRRRHLRAVRKLMPAAWAAGIRPITATRSMSKRRPSNVKLASCGCSSDGVPLGVLKRGNSNLPDAVG